MNHEKNINKNKDEYEKHINMKLNQKDKEMKKFKSHEGFFVPSKNIKNNNKKLKENNGKTNIKPKDKYIEISQIKNKIIEESKKIENHTIENNSKLLNTEKKFHPKLNKNNVQKNGFEELKYKKPSKFMSSTRKRNGKRINDIFNGKTIQELYSLDLENNNINLNKMNKEINNDIFLFNNLNEKNVKTKNNIKRDIVKKLDFEKYKSDSQINGNNKNKKCKNIELNRDLLLNCKKGDKEKVLEILSTNLIDINFQNENGWSALHYACDEGNLKIVEILIKSKINLNLITNEKKTSLHLSVIRGYFDISKLLIENGANINCLDNEKNLPLHLCAMEGHVELLNYLLEKNSKNINEKNLFGKTALDLANNIYAKLAIQKYIKLNEGNEEVNQTNIDNTNIGKYSDNQITNYNNLNKSNIFQEQYSLIKIHKTNRNKIQFLMMPINNTQEIFGEKGEKNNNNINNNSSSNRYKNYILPRKISTNSNNVVKKIDLSKPKEESAISAQTNNYSYSNINMKKNKSNINNPNKRRGIFNINITNNYISYLPAQENMIRYNTLSNMSTSRKKKSKNEINSTYSHNSKTIDNGLKGKEIFCDNGNSYGKIYNYNSTNKNNNKIGALCQISTQKTLVKKGRSKILEIPGKRTLSLKKFQEGDKKLNKDFPLYLKKILKKDDTSKNKKKKINNKKKYTDNLKKINYRKMIYTEEEAGLIDDLDEEIEINLHNSKKIEKTSKKIINEKRTEELNKEKKEKEKEGKIGPNDFVCLALLGQGSFGEVYLVKKKGTEDLYAMKVLDKCRIEKQNIYKYVFTERNVMISINNPFIVKLYYSFQSNEKLFLILEYCPNGDLSKQLKLQKRFSEEKARFYICEIILALGELHKNDIIYRDLKPDNILIDKDGHALLTDFGLSREGVYDKDIAKSFCGSIAYLAPEMLNRRGHGKAVDWYLLGVIFYEMLVGVPPFFTPNQEEIFRNIIQTEVYIPSFVSKKAQKLIKLLLKKNPEQRLGAKKDMDELKENEYFSDIDWDKIYNKKCKPPQIILDKQKLEYFKEPILFSEDYDNIVEDENDLFIKDSCNIEDNDKKNELFSNDIPFNKYEGWSFAEKPISS